MPCILKIKFNFVLVYIITAKNKELFWKFSAAPFLPVFGKISQNSATNFFFLRPLLSFLAGISATWQHCWGSIHCRPGRYGKSQLCVVVLLRTEKTCRPGRYGKESRAGSRQDSLPYRPSRQVLSVLTQTHTLTQYRSDRQQGQWVRWCGGAVCCDLQLILIVFRLLVWLSLKF